VRVHELAQPGYQIGHDLERQRRGHMAADVLLPFVDHEIGLVHELVRAHRRRKITAFARRAVATDERLEHVTEERPAASFGGEDVGTSARQPCLECAAGDGVSQPGAHTGEHPRMVEQDEVERNAARRRDFKRGIEVGEEVHIEAGRQIPLVVDDAGPAIAEHEPSHDVQPQARHLVEIPFDGDPARRHAQMRPPHVGAEVEPVEDCLAVRGPWVVAPMREMRRHFDWIASRYFRASVDSEPW
jgi:hypothetical protein